MDELFNRIQFIILAKDELEEFTRFGNLIYESGSERQLSNWKSTLISDLDRKRDQANELIDRYSKTSVGRLLALSPSSLELSIINTRTRLTKIDIRSIQGNSFSQVEIKTLLEYYFHFCCNLEFKDFWFLKPNFSFSSSLLRVLYFKISNDEHNPRDLIRKLLDFELDPVPVKFSALHPDNYFHVINREVQIELQQELNVFPSMIPSRSVKEANDFIFELDLFRSWLEESLTGKTLAYRYID